LKLKVLDTEACHQHGFRRYLINTNKKRCISKSNTTLNGCCVNSKDWAFWALAVGKWLIVDAMKATASVAFTIFSPAATKKRF
jgi:hypothetical protein